MANSSSTKAANNKAKAVVSPSKKALFAARSSANSFILRQFFLGWLIFLWSPKILDGLNFKVHLQKIIKQLINEKLDAVDSEFSVSRVCYFECNDEFEVDFKVNACVLEKQPPIPFRKEIVFDSNFKYLYEGGDQYEMLLFYHGQNAFGVSGLYTHIALIFFLIPMIALFCAAAQSPEALLSTAEGQAGLAFSVMAAIAIVPAIVIAIIDACKVYKYYGKIGKCFGKNSSELDKVILGLVDDAVGHLGNFQKRLPEKQQLRDNETPRPLLYPDLNADKGRL